MQVSFIAQVRQDVYQIPDCTGPLDDDPDCVGQLGDVQKRGRQFRATVLDPYLHEQRPVLTSSVMYHLRASGLRRKPQTTIRSVTSYHHSSQYFEGAEENLRMSFSHQSSGCRDLRLRPAATRPILQPGVYRLRQLADAAGVCRACQRQSYRRPWVRDTFEAAHWLNLSGQACAVATSTEVISGKRDRPTGSDATILLPRLNWTLSSRLLGQVLPGPTASRRSRGHLVAYAHRE